MTVTLFRGNIISKLEHFKLAPKFFSLEENQISPLDLDPPKNKHKEMVDSQHKGTS